MGSLSVQSYPEKCEKYVVNFGQSNETENPETLLQKLAYHHELEDFYYKV